MGVGCCRWVDQEAEAGDAGHDGQRDGEHRGRDGLHGAQPHPLPAADGVHVHRGPAPVLHLDGGARAAVGRGGAVCGCRRTRRAGARGAGEGADGEGISDGGPPRSVRLRGGARERLLLPRPGRAASCSAQPLFGHLRELALRRPGRPRTCSRGHRMPPSARGAKSRTTAPHHPRPTATSQPRPASSLKLRTAGPGVSSGGVGGEGLAEQPDELGVIRVLRVDAIQQDDAASRPMRKVAGTPTMWNCAEIRSAGSRHTG